MQKSSHDSSNNIKRVGNENCKKKANKHSFKDINKMCKEKLNTLTDCTGNCYNIEELRLNMVYITKFRVNEYNRVYICSRTRLHISKLPQYVEKEYNKSFPCIHSYTDGMHKTKHLIMEDK